MKKSGKEKSGGYWLLLAGFILLLAIGVVLLIAGVQMGRERIFLPGGDHI